ncbi:MAG: DUF4860 domain-containing protein [Lachnospiraceae bacterium]
MKKYRSKSHSIDLLFTISLFFVFTITALYVTMAGANLYENMVQRTSFDYSVFTPVSYLEQKLQGYDTTGGISIQKKDGMDILCLHETLEDSAYTTYIYTKDGNLMELFVKDGSAVSFENGTTLMESGTLHLKEEDRHLLTVEFTEDDGSSQALTLHLRAKED